MTRKTKAASKRDGGARILQGLDDALAWARGGTRVMVHLPGQPGRMMTRAGYEDARAAPVVKTEE
jgi:hypothetical protein